MGKTSIEWTDCSWNPVVGCTEVSPGCANCYAARLAATRLKNLPDYQGLAHVAIAPVGSNIPYVSGRPHWTGEVRLLEDRLQEPLHWKKPQKIFVCDMGDLFHESVPDVFLIDVWKTMALANQHTFQVLTKRPKRMKEFLAVLMAAMGEFRDPSTLAPFLPNVWLGVSVENQHFADERIPLLLQTPAAVRFISAEPLLGLTRVRRWMRHPGEDGPRIDWVICGGESGANARIMEPAWVRQLRDECEMSMVPFFFKQWGEFAPLGTYTDPVAPNRTWSGVNLGNGQMMLRYGKKKAGRLLDGREWNEFPAVQP